VCRALLGPTFPTKEAAAARVAVGPRSRVALCRGAMSGGSFSSASQQLLALCCCACREAVAWCWAAEGQLPGCDSCGVRQQEAPDS
jgi:hypothetical protein